MPTAQFIPYRVDRTTYALASTATALTAAVLLLATVTPIASSAEPPAPNDTAAGEGEGQTPLSPSAAGEQPEIAKLSTRQSGEDWPIFLGPHRDGKSTETGIRTDWQRNPPPLVWSRPLGESYSMGVTAGGRFIQCDRIDGQGVVSCLHSETGELLWETTYDYEYADIYGYNSGPRASPLIDHDLVYVYGVDGQLLCLRLFDGQTVWTQDLNKRFGVVQNFFGVASTPVVVDDLLLVMVGGSPEEDQQIPRGALDRVTSNGSAIVALEKRTGRVRYQIIDDLASYASLQLAHYADRDWCFAFLREALVAFEPHSGQIDFRFPWRAASLESVNAATPVCHEDQVFISETYGPGSALLQFRPGGFKLLWADSERVREKAMQAHWTTPIYHEGSLYGCSGRHPYNAELRCIDWQTGQLRWSQPGLTRCSLVYVDGHFVVLGEDGSLYLVRANPERFELVAKMDWSRLEPAEGNVPGPQYPSWAAPIVAHGLLYLRGHNRLYCLELIPET